MKHLLTLFVCMLLAVACLAQQKPKPAAPRAVKTISGIQTERLTGPYGVSADGTTAVLCNFNSFLFVDVVRGSVRQVNREYMDLSPDLRYNWSCHGLHYLKQADGAEVYRSTTIVKAVNAGERDTLVSEYFTFGMDAQGHLIGTKSVLAQDGKSLSCFVGLYTIDRRTGQPIATLRTDTIYQVGRYGFGRSIAGGTPELWSLQPSLLVIKAGKQWLQAFPFNSTEVATIHHEQADEDAFQPDLIDAAHVYLHRTSYRDGREFTAYSLRTGKLAAQHKFPDAKPNQMLYAPAGNRLYRYDMIAGKVYAEDSREGVFVATDSFAIPDLKLAQSQQWCIQVCKGPSLLFTPLDMAEAEAGGAEANTASLVQLPSGKVSLRITPFYNRAADVLAQQAAAARAWEAQAAKDRVENERLQKERDAERCKEAWNNTAYRKGQTRLFRNTYVILESYDCAKDVYRFFMPRQPDDHDVNSTKSGWQTASRADMKLHGTASSKQYHTCSACDGVGKVLETTTKTRTKELPWGYFSHIETRSTRTTTTEEIKLCGRCGGRGVVLE